MTAQGLSHDTDELPTPLTGLRAFIGLPTHREVRAQFETLRLFRDPVWERGSLAAANGEPFLLVPGFMGSEASLWPLRQWLGRLGFMAEIAPVGLNAGPSASGAAAVEAAARDLHARTGERITLIGHSRGGQHATVSAVRAPEVTRALITLGSPLRFAQPRHFLTSIPVSTLRAVGRAVLGSGALAREDRYDRDLLAPFPTSVERVSVYSKSDGIVDWRASVVGSARNIEVRGSHLGLATNAQVYRVLVDAFDEIFGPRA